MNEGEDLCGCLACAALCGVCCVAAAEEDKRERERTAAAAAGYQQLTAPVIHLKPVAVASPRTQKAYYEDFAQTQREARKAALNEKPLAYY